MPKLVSLTRERRSENWSSRLYFVAQDNVVNPEEAMRKAISEFLCTEQGKEMIAYSCGDFNWGDAVMSMPDEFWEKHGMEIKYNNKEYLVSGETIDVIVNQDEVLIEDKHMVEVE